MILSHRIQLDPTCKQRTYFAQACGTSRFVYNWALAEWNRQYSQGLKPTAAALKKQFNGVKYELYPWLEDIHRDAHSQPFTNLGQAFVSFFKGNGRRPRFHKKGRKDSFYVSNDKLRIDGKRVRLPVVGWVRLTEVLRFSGKIMSATVKRVADRWFISIAVDAGEVREKRKSHGTVGVDLGITTLATLSTGEKIAGPRALKSALSRLRRLSRSHARKQKGSKNRCKLAQRLAKLHATIANIRRDAVHKLTTRLCRENQAIALEDLAVKNMARNRKLARSVLDAGWSEIRRQLTYKAEIYACRIVVVDRFFPSSKMCHRCGIINDDLTLSDRVFSCVCGYNEDRDVNAARNIHTVGLTGIHAWGEDGSGSGNENHCETSLAEPGTKPCSLVSTN